jgi:hypothetical protein
MAQKPKPNHAAAAKRRASRQIAERIKLGPTAYSVKQKVTPAAWRTIVRTAHKKGYTVSGELSDAPNALKERLPSSLRTQAAKEVSSAFKPAGQELDLEATQASNLRTKRLDDETTYNNWLAQQTSNSAAAAQKAQQDYQDFVDKNSGAAQTAAAQLMDAARARSNAGALADQSGAVALGAAQDSLNNTVNSAQNAAAAAHANEPQVATTMAAIQAAVQGQHSRMVSGIEGDYSKTKGTIDQNRLKLSSDRAQAILGRYSDLLGKEIDKANANRNFEVEAQTLNLKAKTQAQQHAEFLIGQQTSRKNARLAAATTRAGQNLAASTQRRGQDISANTQKRGQDIQQQIAADNRAATARNAQLDRALRKNLQTQKIKAQANTPAALKANANAWGAIKTIRDIIRNQQKGPHGKPGTGYLFDPDTKKWLPTEQVLINRGASSPQINAARVLAQGGRLTPQQKRALGIL